MKYVLLNNSEQVKVYKTLVDYNRCLFFLCSKNTTILNDFMVKCQWYRGNNRNER